MLVLLLVTLSYAGEIYRITPKTFDKVVNQTNILIRFCPPYLTECRQTQSPYEGLVDSFEEYEDDVVFGEFDCGKYSDWCDEHKFSSHYPIYAAYTQNNKMNTQIYPLDHNTEELRKFITQVFALTTKPLIYTTILSDKNFNEIVKNPRKNVVVLFYKYWCAYSRLYIPIYEQLAKNYANENDLVIARIDCTTYQDICDQNKIDVVPLLKRYTTYDKTPFPVNIERTLSDGIDWKMVENQVHMALGMNLMIWHITFFDANDKEDRIEKCKEYPLGKYYIDIMKMILNGTTEEELGNLKDDLEFEIQRKGKHMSPQTLDEKVRKLNVIKKFI
ncbi:protein disulfide-isomerase [Entamoeba marina]